MLQLVLVPVPCHRLQVTLETVHLTDAKEQFSARSLTLVTKTSGVEHTIDVGNLSVTHLNELILEGFKQRLFELDLSPRWRVRRLAEGDKGYALDKCWYQM